MDIRLLAFAVMNIKVSHCSRSAITLANFLAKKVHRCNVQAIQITNNILFLVCVKKKKKRLGKYSFAPSLTYEDESTLVGVSCLASPLVFNIEYNLVRFV